MAGTRQGGRSAGEATAEGQRGARRGQSLFALRSLLFRLRVARWSDLSARSGKNKSWRPGSSDGRDWKPRSCGAAELRRGKCETRSFSSFEGPTVAVPWAQHGAWSMGDGDGGWWRGSKQRSPLSRCPANVAAAGSQRSQQRGDAARIAPSVKDMNRVRPIPSHLSLAIPVCLVHPVCPVCPVHPLCVRSVHAGPRAPTHATTASAPEAVGWLIAVEAGVLLGRREASLTRFEERVICL